MGAAAPFAVASGLQIAGSMYSYKAQRAQGMREQQYYNYLADQNEKHAKLTLKRGAEQITAIQDVGAQENLNLHRQVSTVRGSQKAAIAANGIASGSVTAEDIARSTDTAANIDEEAIRFDADAKSWATSRSAMDTATALREQAVQYRMAGSNAREGGNIEANASLLNGATSVAKNWMDYGRTSMGRTAPTVRTRSSLPRGYPPLQTNNPLLLY